ncbi:MAG: GntR family transcriptional regulator [Sphaerochaetaceae bacterium]
MNGQKTMDKPAFNIVDEIVSDLIVRIEQNEFKPGDKLKELDICSQYNISRTPVREAFRLLQNQGYLQYLPNRGVQVAKFDLDDLTHYRSVIGVLEVLSSKSAAEFIDDAGILRLHEINEKFLKAEIADEQLDMDLQFHTVIRDYSHNPVLQEMVPNLIHRTRILQHTIPFRKERIPYTYHEHENIIRALELKDSELSEKYTELHFRMSMISLKQKMLDYLEHKGENASHKR